MRILDQIAFSYRAAIVAGALLLFITPRAQANLYITDDNGVSRFDFSTSTLSSLVPQSGNAAAMTGVAVGPNGNLFVAASLPVPQIFQYDRVSGAQIGSGPFVFYEGTPPSPDPHDVIIPQGMQFSPLNQNLYVADLSGSTSNAHIYGPTGASLGAITDPSLDQPNDVTFDKSGNLYIVNPGFANVLVSALGTGPLTEFVASLSGGLTNPTALTFGPDGKLYVLDSSTPSIDRYNSNGSFDAMVISFGLFQPSDLAFGPDGKLYIAGVDSSNNTSEILRYTSDGTADGVLIGSGLLNPHFITFDVPEPGSIILAALGFAGLAALGWRRRKH